MLHETIRIGGIDLVHIHAIWQYPGYAAWSAARAANLPVVISPRSCLYADSLRKSAWVKRTARVLFVNRMMRGAAFIHSTDASETEAVTAAGFGATPIETIPNGINPIDISGFDGKAHALARLGLGTDPEAPHVLFLSRVDPRKKTEDLIDAFAASRACASAQLMIADPPQYRAYQAMLAARAETCGIAERVHFMGMLRGDALTAAYAAADVFCLPTKFENFGLAIGEALSAGLPVVTTNRTPWQEAEDAGAGVLTDVGDIPGLAAGLDRFEPGCLATRPGGGGRPPRGRALHLG